MTAVLLPEGKQQFFTTPGVPAVGYKLMTWAAGTTTPQTTWADALKVAANPNPIILDARGEAVIFWDGAYKIQLQDPTGAPVWSPIDNVQSQPQPSVSLIPTVDNSLTLGSAFFSWANLFLGPNHAPVLDTVSGNFGYYARTTAEIAAAITPSNFVYPELHPLRYGPVGDGVADDTIPLNRWVAVVNASTNPVSNWPSGLKFLCAPLNPITANNFTWHMNSTLVVKPNTWSLVSTVLTLHVPISGTGARIFGLTMNGNQANFSGAPFGELLGLTGNDVLLDGCSLTQSPSAIALFNGVVGGRVANCHFDNNVNTLSLWASSYVKFVNCTFNVNGYPWGTAVVPGVPNAAGGFGVAVRFRSHHITFTNCEATQNCRDGININQGSYAVKFIGTLAWMNGDGGFTIAADNQATGKPGEGESCYDLEYVDCEAYNNWGCGGVAYAPCFNVTVDGGRYYNNHRNAGMLAEASSFYSGWFFAGGSQGIRVRTKAYDDRQICGITTNSSGVFAATGWVAGTMGNYPRVAIYNATLQFQGYGNITAEAAGSVTITSSTNSGVTIASIVPGWFVSQRVQHNGVFFDNNCTGTADVDGFGFFQGVFPSLSGLKTLSGCTAGGQNVLLPDTVDYTELLLNPTFDAGTGVGVSWTYNLPGGGAANAYATADANNRSPGALQLVGGTSVATGDSTLIPSGLSYAQGAFVEASCWVNSTLPGNASLALQWNPGTGALATVVQHPGGGYRQLKIGGYIPAGTTTLNIRLTSAIGKTNFFDNASLRVKSDYYDVRDFTYPTRNLPV